jgi:hypothetical protein
MKHRGKLYIIFHFSRIVLFGRESGLIHRGAPLLELAAPTKMVLDGFAPQTLNNG